MKRKSQTGSGSVLCSFQTALRWEAEARWSPSASKVAERSCCSLSPINDREGSQGGRCGRWTGHLNTRRWKSHCWNVLGFFNLYITYICIIINITYIIIMKVGKKTLKTQYFLYHNTFSTNSLSFSKHSCTCADKASANKAQSVWYECSTKGWRIIPWRRSLRPASQQPGLTKTACSAK